MARATFRAVEMPCHTASPWRERTATLTQAQPAGAQRRARGAIERVWHCWSLGRETYWETEVAEGYLESGWSLSADQLDPTKGNGVGPGSGSPCFARRQAGDQQSFGCVMSKAERHCLAFISETKAVESRDENIYVGY